MTREVRMREGRAGGRVTGRLLHSEEVWDRAYATVMKTDASRPLHRFWLHYYGAEAEMVFEGDKLMELQADIEAVMAAECDMDVESRAFLRALHAMSVDAWEAGAKLEVIAD